MTIVLDARDTAELSSILEFFAGWLRADSNYARGRLPLYNAYSVDELQADTARLITILTGS